MVNEFSYELGRRDISRLRERPPQHTFTAFDREWDLLPDVWPGNAVATGLFTSWLPYEEADSFLEIGCGAGVTAVMAALRGCPRVHASDINAAAVETTRRNARRHGVADRTTVAESDLFAAFDPALTFDLVYWNSPFVEAPADHRNEHRIDFAAFDPDYTMHARFFAEAGRRLTDRGRVFLGFSETLGNPARLLELTARAGFSGSVYRRKALSLPLDLADGQTAPVGGTGLLEVVYVLYEFRLA